MSQDKDAKIREGEALEYHEKPRPGKFEIEPTKPLSTQRELSLAYTPGVAEPCREIAADPEASFRYTNRGNLVGVVSDGSATLGLGDIGPLASKPVMEGKAVLFKHLAGVDAFDIELDVDDVDALVACAAAMEPTFGGINLEDIAAPECFEVEERLRDKMSIPVFHDDQHGTAIITAAALLNALQLQEKSIEDIDVVFAGAGAAGIACARLYHSLGVPIERITMVDIDGVIHAGRDGALNKYMRPFAHETDKRTLGEALEGADVFVGVSAGGIVSQEMVASMAERPIIFALANPNPEITYPEAMEVRDDLIMATGRSDYPNQVNNVLGFPFIFRGALDVAATTINEEMKKAAVEAIAELAQEEVPEVVSRAYGEEYFTFGPEYIIPKAFDPRALLRIAPAVARAAGESGVARRPIEDMEAYCETLERLQSKSKALVRRLINKAKNDPRRILLPEGGHDSILRAAQILVDEGIAHPVLLGDIDRITGRADELDIDLTGVELFDHRQDPRYDEMVQAYYERRQRHGVTENEAYSIMKHREPYAMMMVECGRADGVVSGVKKAYKESLRPALEIIGVEEDIERASGAYIVVSETGIKFFADTTVNIEPDANTLAEIAINASDLATAFDIEPRVAMLSYSNFGTSDHPMARKVSRAARILKEMRPDLPSDGEMQVEAALDADLRERDFGFSTLEGAANVLVFPDLDAGNIAYKLMYKLGEAEVIGPVLLGMAKPVNVLQRACSVSSIVNLTVITVLKSQADAPNGVEQPLES
jgi:malate dehydrogenase (oxaloacetate-decarboxylating)(NADP+)